MSDLILEARIGTLTSSLGDVSTAIQTAEGRHRTVNEIRASIVDALEALDEIKTQVKVANTYVLDLKDKADLAKEPLNTLKEADAVERAISQLDRVRDRLHEMTAWSYAGLGGDSAPSRETLDETIQKTAKQLRNRLEAAGDEQQAAEAWGVVLGEVAPSIPALYQDYVDLLRGLALRDLGLDDGMCAIVDQLMRGVDAGQISRWRSLTVPSLDDTISVDMAKIIRLGFGDWSLWSLPLTAAQYGKMLLGHQALEAEFGIMEEAQQQFGPAYPLLVADAFATYVMGPAYASAAIVLKLDPRAAVEPVGEGQIAKPDQERAIVILDMLDRLDSEEDGVFESHRVVLSSEWDSALTQVGNTNRVAADRRATLVEFTERMFKTIEGAAANPIPYDETWYAPASGWRENLLEWYEMWKNREADPEAPQELIDVSSLENTERDFRHVLNAAWLGRLDHPERVAEIEVAARELLRLLEETPLQRGEFELRHEERTATAYTPGVDAGSAKQ